MFYSETLLSKTGPLARVWLSANIERKLSKTHILQSNLQDSVEAIITPSQAPMALRLSGQLLLGVVRIYSRKARYLLDDCNEALMKIKMAFRSSGNNDLPANQQSSNRESLLLPDRITPYDNLDLLPRPDPDFFLSQTVEEFTATPSSSRRAGRGNNRDINLQEDYNNSQFLEDAFNKDDDLAIAGKDDLELDLDFGLDLGDPLHGAAGDASIEMGRDAPAPQPFEDDDMFDFDLEPRGKDGPTGDLTLGDGVRIADDDGDIRMDGDDMQFNLGEASVMPGAAGLEMDMSRARISESPLSDVNDDDVRQGELEFSRHNGLDMYDAGDSQGQQVSRRAPQRIKRMKVLESDAETMLASNVIRDQQSNRDGILKPQSFLPQDAYVLALMEMRKANGFVSNILLGSRSAAWAPELRGLLSYEAIHGANELKRKRDSGIADMDSDQDLSHYKSPRLDLGAADDDDHLGFEPSLGGGADLGNQSAVLGPDGTMLEIPGAGFDDETSAGGGDMNVSSMSRHASSAAAAAAAATSADGPLLSLGTKHAVHILRDIFSQEAEGASPGSGSSSSHRRKKTTAVLQQVLPEGRTTKADATRMFFECLVLATKDAIKIEQASDALGGPIRLQSKSALWGSWAEREDAGETEIEDAGEEQEGAVLASGPAMVSAQA
ncbi:double-strand-break repair protein rad21 [Grosmannia clavigera kw1407]|uniref:Double-strand-break repair protein rad21 n=1 Tax=Grosmannia clavigera (strain kw1407 / UAMH 11150) TaxID=655863 RepID=F0XR75_GROCL|nr:double-strand-break repair protein rad21 [Grosmannia clavigera kw1407]EFW99873.1 double-strand-break repair protein rad21 [Grosmannia clavigera kw1407]